MSWVHRFRVLVCLLGFLLVGGQAWAADTDAQTPTNGPLLQLGPGDQVKMEVYGRPEMDTTTYIGDDGTIRVPLAGAVKVGGTSPTEAAKKVEAALKSGEYLVDPHVTFTVLLSRSQRASVLGEVKTPGRYAIESNTTVVDLLAQAGGTTEKGSDTIYILRADANGKVQRIPVDLHGLQNGQTGVPQGLITLHGGDSVIVPAAEHCYVGGEVRTPAAYKIDTGMTLLGAIARAGGLTEKGSSSRVTIKRKTATGDYVVISGHPTDLIQPDDVITVKERIF